MTSRYATSSIRGSIIGGGLLVLASCFFSQTHAAEPTANAAWFGCELSAATVASIIDDFEIQNINSNQTGIAEGNGQISYVAIFVHDHPNFGQARDAEGEFTGVVWCRNPNAVNMDDTAVSEADQIPSSGTVDVLDAEDIFLLRYVPKGGLTAGDADTENRVCSTTDSRTDCATFGP